MNSAPRWVTWFGIAMLASLLAGCGGSVTSLSDEQLRTQLVEAEAEWKTTGAGVDEKDAAYIPTPRFKPRTSASRRCAMSATLAPSGPADRVRANALQSKGIQRIVDSRADWVFANSMR